MCNVVSGKKNNTYLLEDLVLFCPMMSVCVFVYLCKSVWLFLCKQTFVFFYTNTQFCVFVSTKFVYLVFWACSIVLDFYELQLDLNAKYYNSCFHIRDLTPMTPMTPKCE